MIGGCGCRLQYKISPMQSAPASAATQKGPIFILVRKLPPIRCTASVGSGFHLPTLVDNNASHIRSARWDPRDYSTNGRVASDETYNLCRATPRLPY